MGKIKSSNRQRKCFQCGETVANDFDMVLSLDGYYCSVNCAIEACKDRVASGAREYMRLEGSQRPTVRVSVDDAMKGVGNTNIKEK